MALNDLDGIGMFLKRAISLDRGTLKLMQTPASGIWTAFQWSKTGPLKPNLLLNSNMENTGLPCQQMVRGTLCAYIG